MAQSLSKRILRILALFTIREGYLTSRNFLGLVAHPFKTTKRIAQERDPFQVLIIFGFPFYFWLGGVLGIIIGRLLIGAPFFSFGFLAKLSLLLISFVSGAAFAYLAYWVFWYLKSKDVS